MAPGTVVTPRGDAGARVKAHGGPCDSQRPLGKWFLDGKRRRLVSVANCGPRLCRRKVTVPSIFVAGFVQVGDRWLKEPSAQTPVGAPSPQRGNALAGVCPAARPPAEG